MEYMAVWDRDTKKEINYGLHDPAPTYKKLFYYKGEGIPPAVLKASMPFRDIHQAGNSQMLKG